MPKKVFVWASIAFLVFFVAFRPSAVASFLVSARHAVVAIGEFFFNLVA